MKYWYIIIVIFSSTTFSQVKVDHLKAELKLAKTKKDSVELTNNISNFYLNQKVDDSSAKYIHYYLNSCDFKPNKNNLKFLNFIVSYNQDRHINSNEALFYAKEHVQMSKLLKDTSTWISALQSLALLLPNNRAKEKIELAIKLGEILDEDLEVANAYNTLGVVNDRNNQTNEAIKCYLSALEHTHEDSIMMRVYINYGISNCYARIKNLEKLKEFAEKVIVHEDYLTKSEGGFQMYLLAYSKLVFYNLQINNIQQAELICDTLLRKSKEFGNPFIIEGSMYYMADVMEAKGDFVKALNFQDSVMISALKRKDYREITAVQIDKAQTLIKLERNYEAINELNGALDACESSLEDNLEYKKWIHSILYETYKKLHKVEKALYHHEQLVKYNDTLIKTQNKEEALTQELQFKHKQEQLADSLNHQKEIELKDIALKNQEKTAGYQILGVLGGSLLLILMGVLFYYRRKNKLEQEKAVIEQEALVLNQKMLRSQLNPHFLSNSLGAIQSFILKNDKLEASDYLAKFSKLTRLILESSREDKILLEDEIKIIELYLSFQKLRLKDQFNYTIKIAQDIDPQITYLPPMLLQPFIENAVEHGIKNIENGLVEILINGKKNGIEILIKDNGKGIKLESHSSRKSYSTQITRERIDSIEKRYDKKILFDINPEALLSNFSGTIVKFEIPLFN